MKKEKKIISLKIEFEEHDFGVPEDVEVLDGCDNIFFAGGKLVPYEGRTYRLPVTYQFFVDKKTRTVKFVKEL